MTFPTPSDTPPKTAPPEYDLFIDGAWVPARSGAVGEDVNPADGSVYARVAQAGREDAHAALAAADRAWRDWADRTTPERVEVLHRAATILSERRMEFVDVIVDEGGSLPGKAHFEIDYCIALCRSVAADALYISGETLPSTSTGQMGFTIRRPLGVVVGISPFNLPLLITMKKVLPAIAAGNSFVLKPSEETPVVGLKIASLLEQAGLPKGVLNVIPGPADALGDTLTSDPRVKMILFTGSTRVGRRIAAEAGRNLKKVLLEMGGKNAMIILGDADFDYAVETAAFSAFFHHGQACLAGSRIIVEATLYDRFIAAFADRVRGYKVGAPRDEGTVIGPLIRASQCDLISEQIANAVAAGARLLVGGQHSGRYFDPTILADVTTEMPVFSEESFGPLVSIVRAEDAEDALRMANLGEYGLAAAVITRDLALAARFCAELDVGMVFVNDCTLNDDPSAPFGGAKQSGLGREGGRYAMHELTELRWVAVRTSRRSYPPLGY